MLLLLALSALAQTSVGLTKGLGARLLPTQTPPRGAAPRVDLLVIEIRQSMPASAPFSRFDLQVDWVHAAFSDRTTRRPRLPVTAYATWVRPPVANLSQAWSLGVHAESGRDTFTIDETLTRAPAGAIALAGRLGMERSRRWREATTVGTYVRVAVGVNLHADPDLPGAARYGRLGVERSWSWGRP